MDEHEALYRERKRLDDYWEEVENALQDDNGELFVKLINTIPIEQLKLELENEYYIRVVRYHVMEYDAVNCLAAVLAGETKIPALTILLATDQLDNTSEFYTTPLHEAVSRLASRIIVLLLNHGFSPNFRCGFRGFPNCLPLTAFFYKFGLMLMEINSKSRSSAVTLIVELFRPRQKRYLEAARMLALHTRELKLEFVNYLKQGRLVEVGALLLVAKSQLLSPPTDKEEEHDVGFQSITEMHDFLVEAKASSQAHSHLGVIAIDETLLLLKIFDKIGDKLSALHCLNFDQMGFNFSEMPVAASLIEDAGFDVPDYALKPHLPTSILRFQSNVFERAADDGKKMAVTTDMLASRQKEVVARGLGDTYDNNSRICNNSISGSVQEINPASLQIPSQNMMCHHLIKQASRLQGTLKRVSRLA